MFAIRIFQTLWAMLLVGIAANLVAAAPNQLWAVALGLAAIYLVACLGAWGDGRLAWSAAVAAALLSCAWSLWYVVAGMGEARKLAAEGFLTVILILTAPLLLPSLCLLGLMWYHRDAVLARLRGR